MIVHRYSVGEIVITVDRNRGVIESLGSSIVDGKEIPSYWIKFPLDVYADGFSRNIFESTIEHKIYTSKDALKIKTDYDVLYLPDRIYYDEKETMLSILGKLNRCHIRPYVNHEEKYILK
jgi:hypothetical protein